MNHVDLVLSIAAWVMLGLEEGEGSVRGLVLLCVLSISLPVRWCESCDMDELCAFSRLGLSLGKGIVLFFLWLWPRVCLVRSCTCCCGFV